MVNVGNLWQYLVLQSPLQSHSGDQLNATTMSVSTYTLPQLPYAYDVSPEDYSCSRRWLPWSSDPNPLKRALDAKTL